MEKKLKPEPVADPKLTKKILEMLQQLLPLRQVRKGVNEVLKSITKRIMLIILNLINIFELFIQVYL